MNDRYMIRRNKIRRLFSKRNLDALLVTKAVNIRYLTGFTGGDSFLILKRDGDVLLSDARFTIQIEEECPGLEALIRPGGVSMSKAVFSVLGKSFGRSISGRLGVEAESMTLADQARIFEHLRTWEAVPTSGLVESLRQIKDRDEIALIRNAIDVAYRGFLDIRENLRPEQTEIDIRNDLEYRMRLHGAEEKSFASIIGAGPRAALPHGVPSTMRLAGQSHLLIDWGAISGGYMSDLTRVLIFSPKNKKLRSVYETVLKAQEAAIRAIKPGRSGQEIDAIARSVIEDAGFGRHFNHGLGHALGLEIHEDPRFAIGHATLLKPGMVLTVEPGIYLKNWGGVRIEDDVLITRTGCEVLSRKVPKAFDDMVV